jgi:hypothetical protein
MREYQKDYPDQEINIIALSGGAGVTLWALEKLKGDYRVNNVFLLGASVSSDFDVSKALRSVKGKVYVYYGAADHVIGLATCNLDELLEYARSG